MFVHLQELFDAIREEASTASWSRAVKLVRSDAVVGRHHSDDELELSVAQTEGRPAATVHLYPDDADWVCGCSSAEPACEHAAAAVIALRQAQKAQRSLFGAETSSNSVTVAYRLRSTERGLSFQRVLVRGGEETVLDTSLGAATQQSQARIIAGQQDWRVERALQTHHGGVLPKHIMRGVLEALAGCDVAQLDGAAVEIGEPTSGLQAIVEDCAEGFRVRLEQADAVTRVFANGAVKMHARLHPLDEDVLSPERIRSYRRGAMFGDSELPELVTEVLPELRGKMPVSVRTPRLPRAGEHKPRLQLHTERDGDTLSVLPRLVYGDPPVARVDGDTLVHLEGAIPVRRPAEERRLVRRLHDELGLTPGIRHTAAGAAGVELADRLRAFDADALSGAGHQSFYVRGSLSPRVDLARGLAVDFPLSGDGIPAGDGDAGHATTSATRGPSPRAVLEAFMRGDPMVALPDGGFATLPAEWLAQHGRRLADLLAAKEADAAPAVVKLEAARLAEAADVPGPDLQQLASLMTDGELPEAQLPEAFAAVLRDYQQVGVRWLSLLRDAGLGGLLADDMGLGKTVQTLASIRGRTLIVAPTSVLPNWRQEIARFRPDLEVCLYHGPKRQLLPTAAVTLTSYALLRLDREALGAVDWNTVVLDEAQAIKNPSSQAAQAAFAMGHNAFRVALTGTPVENRLEELWSQMHFTNPGLLGSRSDFRERYEAVLSSGDAVAAAGAQAKLRERIRPFVLRRTKEEVAPELPERTDLVLHCTLSDAERAVYDAVRAATQKDVVERLQSGGSVLEALEALLRLRQAACHPALVPGQTADTSAKLALLTEKLHAAVAEGHKALVFSQWTALLDLAEPELDAAGLTFARLDGATANRGAVIERFQASDGPPIMLVSLKAGGTGLNLTAADHVFLLDPWWNPAVEDQAADRAHRIGQQNPVFVHRLIATDTVEERIVALQERKRAVADAALGQSEYAPQLTREDILALLEAG